jgi:hypothetical protein
MVWSPLVGTEKPFSVSTFDRTNDEWTFDRTNDEWIMVV